MASITTRPNGDRWIQFFQPNKKRATLRCGPISLDDAKEIKRHVENIVVARKTNMILPMGTAAWVRGVSGEIRERMLKLGLIDDEADHGRTLKDLCEYVTRRYENNPPNTRRNIARTVSALKGFFGQNRLLSRFTVADADEFRESLRQDGLAETTVTGICKKSKTIFRHGVDKEWMQSNPFRRLKGWTHTDESRRHFVDRKTVEFLISKCEPEWQLIIALARYGGVQAPSEMLDLKWSWIDLPAGTMKVFKRKNSRSKPFREAPIFPDLRPHLEAAHDRAGRSEFVVTKHRSNSGKAMYSAFLKRLERAGINPWPKPFVNMRSSLETELVESFPIHLVAYWLGNSPAVAVSHYLQVTPDHYERAKSWSPEANAEAVSRGIIPPEPSSSPSHS